MAKARGNKLVPPANYSRNPMGAPLSQGPVQPFVNQTNNDLEGYIQYAESYGQVPLFSGTSEGRVYRNLAGAPPVSGVDVQDRGSVLDFYRNLAGAPPVSGGGQKLAPRSFNPQNQGLDFSGLLALYGENRPSQQTGRNPRLTTPNTPLVSNSMMPYRGPSAVDMAGDRASAAQIRNSANQINSLIARSQAANPMVPRSPGFGVVDPATESTRRLAPMLAQDAARQQNTPMNGNTAYANNPLRLTPDQKLSLAEQSTARYMGGGAAADPTRLAGRFNPMADQINSQANAVASGRGWYLGGKFVGATGNPQWGKEENMRRRVELNNAPQQATQEQRDSAQARRAGAQRQFMDENNGMNYLQARRAERQAGLKERSFRKAVTRGLNPMSPEAQALFPQQVAKMKGQPSVQADQNPMLQAFQPGAPNTPENLAAKDSVRSKLEADSPTVRAMGIAGGDPQQAITSLASFQGDVSDDGLTDLHSYVLSIPRDKDRAHPFESVGDETLAPELMGELYNLPPNTPPATLRKWYDKYRAAVNARRFGNTPQNQQQQYSQGWSGSGNMPVMPFNAPMGR